MQLTIDRNQLDSILTKAVTTVANKPIIPSLTGVRLTLDKHNLTVTTSNEDISLIQTIPVKDDDHPLQDVQADDILLPARYLQKLIKKFTGDTVKFKTTDNPGMIYVSSGKSKFKLAYQQGSAFPKLPQIGQAQHYQITNQALQKILKQDLISASNNEARPALNGINFNLNPAQHQLRAVATDSHRLSRTIEGVQELDDSQDTINETIPATSLKALEKITNKYPDDQILDLFHSTEIKQMQFKVDNLIIYCRSLDVQYPNTEQLMPKEPNLTIKLDRHAFYQVMDRMSLASNTDQVANLTVNSDGQAEIANDDNKDVCSAQEPLETDEINFTDKNLQDENFKIAFNIDYIKDGLKAMTGDTVIISFWESLRPFTITDPDNTDFIYLVTPIRVF